MPVSVQTNARNVHDGGLRIVVSEIGTTTTIALEGEWDVVTQLAIRQALGRALACRPECVVLDLSGLGFIDSSGVHSVISLTRRTERLSVLLRIVPGPKEVQRIFEVCGLADRLPFTTAA
jgi:anti-anti-sigma factor